MKYVILIFLFLSLANNCYSQKKKNTEVEIIKIEIENKKSQFSDSLKTLNKQIKNLTLENDFQKKQLESKINDASKTIEYLNSLVNSFGQIFTILGIFIAIITLVLPILTYQLGIKPSQKALKDLEVNMDQRLENYLKNSRNKEIENALKNLREGNAELKNQATSFLALTQHEGFSDNQMFQIYTILNKHRDENNVKSQLAFILSTRKNDYAKELFSSDDISKDPVIKQMAYLYYAKIGFKENYEGILKILGSSENQYQEFLALAFNLMQYSSGEVVELFNDETIVDSLSNESLKTMDVQLRNSLISLNLVEELYEKTYLAEKIKSA
jgi:hypothetical protein